MKRLLFITHSSALFGGAEDEFERLLKYFSTKKSDYFIEGLFPKGDRSNNYSVYCDVWSNYRSGTFPEVYLGILKIVKYIIISVLQIRDINKFLKGKKFDAAIVNVSVLLTPIILLKIKKIKSVIFIRESITNRLFRFVIYKLINSGRNQYIGVSKTNTESFKKITKNNNVTTLYSAIESENIVLADENKLSAVFGADFIGKMMHEDAFPIFSVAPICTRKNQKLLIEGLKLLLLSEINFKPYLVIIGQKTNDEKYSDEVEKLIDKYGVRENCYLPGSLDKDILYSLYKYAKAIVISSTSEGLPLILVEAFKNKIPLVTTNVGGIGEFVKEGESGYFIENNPASLIEKLILVRTGKDKTEKMKEKCYLLYKENFNLNKNLKAVEEMVINLSNT